MTEHTKGEWKYGVRRDGSIWLSIGNPSSGPHYQGDLCASIDDARLIATAPDLLAALKDAQKTLQTASRQLTEDHKMVLMGRGWGWKTMATIEGAIAKAIGAA